MVRLLLPFIFCQRNYREGLAQFVENITLAQALGAHSRDAYSKCPTSADISQLIIYLCYGPFVRMGASVSVTKVRAIRAGNHRYRLWCDARLIHLTIRRTSKRRYALVYIIFTVQCGIV